MSTNYIHLSCRCSIGNAGKESFRFSTRFTVGVVLGLFRRKEEPK